MELVDSRRSSASWTNFRLLGRWFLMGGFLGEEVVFNGGFLGEEGREEGGREAQISPNQKASGLNLGSLPSVRQPRAKRTFRKLRVDSLAI